MNRREIDFSNPTVATEVFRTLVANTPVAYVILDYKLRIHFINEYFTSLRKLKSHEVIGNLCYNVYNNGVPCALCPVRDAIRSGRRQFLTRRDILPDGTVRYIDDYAIPIPGVGDGQGHILEVMVNRDTERRLRDDNERLFLGLVEVLTAMLDKKDPYTSNHSRDVTKIAIKLARHVGLSEPDVHDIRLAALLHDTGKILIPDDLINKPGSLTADEYSHVMRHATGTADLLSDLSALASIRDMAASHHERWDGRGYPNGLSGTDIPLGGRIIAVADTYDAMTTTRPYREALRHDQAVAEILAGAGTQFDPNLARQFARMAAASFPTRQQMISREGTDVRRRTSSTVKVARRLNYLKHTPTHILDGTLLRDLLSGDQVVQAIMENSPCFYIIVDEEHRVLYASDNLIKNLGMTREKVTKLHCYELDGSDRQSECLDHAGGTSPCPVNRAIQTRTTQEGRVVNRFGKGGRETICDAYAVPITLTDSNGEPFRCVVEILLDRTDEMRMWEAVEGDIKKLLDRLFGLVASMNDEIAIRAQDIIQEAANFSDYLSGMREQMRALSGNRDLLRAP